MELLFSANYCCGMDKVQPQQPKKKPPTSRWPELLREIEDQLIFVFERQGKSNEDAKTDASVTVETLVTMLGGMNIYFPRGTLRQVDEINARIREEFTGNNHTELARKHGKSVIHIYRILKEKK